MISAGKANELMRSKSNKKKRETYDVLNKKLDDYLDKKIKNAIELNSNVGNTQYLVISFEWLMKYLKYEAHVELLGSTDDIEELVKRKMSARGFAIRKTAEEKAYFIANTKISMLGYIALISCGISIAVFLSIEIYKIKLPAWQLIGMGILFLILDLYLLGKYISLSIDADIIFKEITWRNQL